MEKWLQIFIDFAQTIGVVYACWRWHVFDREPSENPEPCTLHVDRVFVEPVKSGLNCTHCGHQLTVDHSNGPRFPVWECPHCKSWWSWVAPPQ